MIEQNPKSSPERAGNMRSQYGPKAIERERVSRYLRLEAAAVGISHPEIAAALRKAAEDIECGKHRPKKRQPTKEVRPITVQGEIGYVPLADGGFALIDASDAPLVGRFNWHATGFSPAYASTRVRGPNGGWQGLSMHRLVLGAETKMETDHVNGDGLDNRRCNLRSATTSQNQANQRRNSRNTTGFKGVDFWKARGMYRARIKVNGQRQHLGYFANAEEAHAAYCAAAVRSFGEFARFE